MAGGRSWWRSGSGGSTSATRTRWPWSSRCRWSARAWTTWSSPPTGGTRLRRASFRARLKLDVAARRVVGYLMLDPDGLGARAMPQDIRASPDGRVFYVADMMANGVHLVDPDAFRRVGFIATGKGTHGIYPSRDGRRMYISNRGWNTTAGGRHGPGSITVLDPATQRIVATWP